MRVTLAIGPWSHEGTLPKTMAARSWLNKKFSMTNSLNYPCGLLYVSASLKSAGHETSFIDGYYHDTDEILAHIEREQPQWFGLSVIQYGWEDDQKLLQRVKERFPQLHTVVGGYYVNHAKERVLHECAAADLAVVGEGEHTSVELCEALAGRVPFSEVKGLAWRDNGQVVCNAPRPRIKEMDTIPFPDYELIDFDDYAPAIGSYKALPSAMMFGSRGCPNRCTFCMSDKVVRHRSAQSVVDEIEWLQREYGVKHFQFFDETFTVFRERALEMFAEFERRGIRVPWTANARADTVDQELLTAMRVAGCWRVHVGAESGVQKNLDALRKDITPQQVRDAIKMINKAGMESYASFIIGIPTETREEALETIRFACSLPLAYANFHNLTPCEGSEIDRHIDECGRIVGPRAFHQITFVPHTMTVEDVAELVTLAYKRFYFRPKFLFKKFFAQRSLEDIRRNLRGFLAYYKLKAEDHYDALRDPSDAPTGCAHT